LDEDKHAPGDVEMIIDLDRIRRLLIIQIRPFGDVLLNTGYLPFLRRRLPHTRIDFLVRHPYEKVLEENPNVDNLMVFRETNQRFSGQARMVLFRDVYRQKYDLVIDQLQGTTSAQIVFFSRAKYRIASTHARWRFLYNIRVPYKAQRYSASMKFDLLQPLGIDEVPYRLHYTIKPDAKKYIEEWVQKEKLENEKLICISPGSPRVKKKWSARCYVELCDLILENTDRKVVLLWGPTEKRDVEEVSAAMQKKPLIAPATDYNQAAAMLQVCDLLVCNDGGLNHLSVATDTPSLAIFGNTSPETWSPEGLFPNHYHLCNPGGVQAMENCFGISPEDVFQKTVSIIKHAKSPENRSKYSE
jgi:heptosyltransferase-3